MNNSRDNAGKAARGAGPAVQARQASKGMFGRRSTAASPGWSRRKKIAALSAIFGIIIGLGVTAAAGGTLYFTFQSQTDPFTASSAVELRNLNVVRDNDVLTVTGVLKNSGQTSISRLWIDNLAVSNIEAFQVKNNGENPDTTSDNLILLVKMVGGTAHLCVAVESLDCVSAIGKYTGINNAANQSLISTRQFDGISMANTGAEVVESVLEGGRTQAFKITISCDGPTPTSGCNTIDISREVAISDRLTITFGYASGDDRLVSDSYSARVRSG